METQTQEAETPQILVMNINPRDECPTCVSGLDPDVGGSPLFQEALLDN